MGESWKMEGGGTLTLEEEGIRVRLWAVRPDDGRGLYKVWVLSLIHILGALSIFGTNALFSVANKLTTAANVIVLQFTAPIFVILFSALFWRRKPGRLDLLACGIVFGGVLFFFADSLEMGGGLGNVLALLLSLIHIWEGPGLDAGYDTHGGV